MKENEDKIGKIQYPVQTARASDSEWEEFNDNRKRLDLSWNQFIKYINKLLKK